MSSLSGPWPSIRAVESIPGGPPQEKRKAARFPGAASPAQGALAPPYGAASPAKARRPGTGGRCRSSGLTSTWTYYGRLASRLERFVVGTVMRGLRSASGGTRPAFNSSPVPRREVQSPQGNGLLVLRPSVTKREASRGRRATGVRRTHPGTGPSPRTSSGDSPSTARGSTPISSTGPRAFASTRRSSPSTWPGSRRTLGPRRSPWRPSSRPSPTGR